MELLVTRHGQTDWNLGKKAQGKTDVPLNAEGLVQAEELAESLLGEGIELVIASPLLRAGETGRIVAGKLGVPMETDARLAEQDFGTYEGGCYLDEGFEEARRQFTVRVGGGESTLDVAHRVYSFLEELRGRGEKKVLVVAHGALCRVLRTYFVEMTNEEFYALRMCNCQVDRYTL